jgi:low affinity Fe/Cu permease
MIFSRAREATSFFGLLSPMPRLLRKPFAAKPTLMTPSVSDHIDPPERSPFRRMALCPEPVSLSRLILFQVLCFRIDSRANFIPFRQGRITMYSETHTERMNNMESKMNEFFRLFARTVSEYAGSFWTFIAALLIVVVWATTGPIFGFSDTWQLIINTGTTIITFIMVFIIQNTQNRDSKAVHLKLDELIRVTKSARNRMLDVEDLSDEQLKKLREQFAQLNGQETKTKTARKPRRKAKEEPIETPH